MSIDLDAVRALMESKLPSSSVKQGESIADRRRAEVRAAMQKLPESRQQFLRMSYGSRVNTAEIDAMRAALKGGKYARPSEYVDKRLDWLFGALIPEYRRPEVLDAVDRCLTQPYAVGWGRRSMRSVKPHVYVEKLQELFRYFVTDVLLPYEAADLLTGKVPSEVMEYLKGASWQHEHASLKYRIAQALDQGDERVTAAVQDILMGESGSVLMRDVICGVVYSHRSDMHELLGRLLLAARLQEGLRQAICENADMGTPEAFMTLLQVIDENDLIRFSSVKRAVGTWLGLFADDSGDLERVNRKSVSLIRRCLSDEAFRGECLQSEDSMAIHIALWAVAFTDVDKAVEMACILAEQGSRHQRLSCGFFLSVTSEREAADRAARRILPAFMEEMDTQAVWLPLLLPYISLDMQYEKASIRLSNWFANAEEARTVYDYLLALHGKIKKKQVFSPCVFPWNSAVIERKEVAERLAAIAVLLRDDALIDQTLQFLPDCDSYHRASLLVRLCGKPRTAAQRSALLAAMCDKSEETRRKALKCVQELLLTKADYLKIEELLRFKYADIRSSLAELLLSQSDEELAASLGRLLGDKLEERRVAALDILNIFVRESKRMAVVTRCRPLLAGMTAPTAKEQPLLDTLRVAMGEQTPEQEEEPLFTEADILRPEPVTDDVLRNAAETYLRYFPDAALPAELGGKKPGLLERLTGKKGRSAVVQAQEDVASLTALLLSHHDDTVSTGMGRESLVSDLHSLHLSNAAEEIALFPVWKQWYEEKLGDPARLLRMCILLNAGEMAGWHGLVQQLFGPGFQKELLHSRDSRVRSQLAILSIDLVKRFVPAEDRCRLALVMLHWLARCVPDKELWQRMDGAVRHTDVIRPVYAMEQASIILSGLTYQQEMLSSILHAALLLARRIEQRWHTIHTQESMLPSFWQNAIHDHVPTGACLPNVAMLLRAGEAGLISRAAIYAWLVGQHVSEGSVRIGNIITYRRSPGKQALRVLTLLADVYRLQNRVVEQRDRWHWKRRNTAEALRLYLGHEQPEGDADLQLLRYADEVASPLVQLIIDGELRRGDAPGDYSGLVDGISHVYGAETFTSLLAALGKDKLLRRDSYDGYIYGGNGDSRAAGLCQLLTVSLPDEKDNGELLRRLVKEKKIGDSRLIEGALYSPEWIELVGEATGLPGFQSAAYYFMAHMKDDFDEVRMARIARYTPLTADELNNGAFDIGWFRSAFDTLGEKHFNMVYDAAKYITSGAKHTRARKYADAALGRLDAAAVRAEIGEKRNKDLLMAYALIPLADDRELQERYLFIQQFLKESRGFGAQRAASEKTAVEIALSNLAMNAGYADAMRLTLRMETRLTQENADLFQPREIEGVQVWLTVDEQGVTSVACEKAGKPLKSIPGKLKKNEHILRLNDMKKQLVEQQRRARRMLEEAMESAAVFTAGEIAALMTNPVMAPMLSKLVFMRGEEFGFTDGLTLTDAQGAQTPLQPEDELILAHPFHLWKAGRWLDYQRCLFDGRIVQPIRQVFRELYVKTPEELACTTSLRYAGHQIQPGRTAACLKGRRWIADPEMGLQKVFYRENLIATIWAMADWFSPSDIEAPTLEHVAFCDRKTGEPVEIGKVPDLVFSEVMRDVDLAVSVAHAGGVDPQSSHSTIEMRAALLSFTLPLFRLTNVRVEGSHALIEGNLARYSIHLGSGVVHQRGGTMLSVLPVHSQHRGKLFLPFADDDPKTAEIISKVLLFADDRKIKDPTILEQIIR